MTLLAVMIGGALGSALRFGLSVRFNPANSTGLPVGTLIANIGGCLLIGWLAAALSNASEPVRLGVLVGVLGGFTTFSSFGLEAIRLFQDGQTSVAIAYVAISNVGGLLGVWMGTRIGG